MVTPVCGWHKGVCALYIPLGMLGLNLVDHRFNLNVLTIINYFH